MDFLEEKEKELMADTKKFANENFAKEPKQDENVPASEPIHPHEIVNIISVLFVIIGIAAFVGGCVIAKDSYRFNFTYFFGGFIAAMFSFGWAAVTRVCALYIRDHNK